MKALIVVDVVNDFCEGGSLAVKDGEKIIPFVNSILPNYPLVIFTSEKHPQDMDAFASNHEGKKPFDTYINKDGEEDTLWPDHCVDGTFGSDFHKDLKFAKAKEFYIFKKGLKKYYHPYSGFGAEGLEEFFEERGVTEVDIVGLAFDYCVAETAIDSAKFGYPTTVIMEGTKSISPDLEPTIQKLEKFGVKLI